MTRIKPVGSNMTELHTSDGAIVLFSYETPVAAYSPEHGGYIRTNQKYSVTTSKHINKWLDGVNAAFATPEEIAALV